MTSGLEAQYPQPLRGQNLFTLDRNLAHFLERRFFDALGRHRPALEALGAFAGGAADEEAEYTDRYAPAMLEPYDREGLPLNGIRKNPLAAAAAREVYALGAVGLNYGATPAPFVLTFAMGYLLSQSNLSLHCPVAMTGALAYVLDRFAPEPLRAQYLDALTRQDGLALSGGTWVTERHGGSDVGGTTTRAVTESDHVRLFGLKWFASNPDGGLALATARPEGAPPGTAGLGLYLVPLHLSDRQPNSLRFRRLKDKLGTRGVATAEIDLDGALAFAVADPPRGFKLMMEALTFSRIHNAMSGAGVMRRALLEAVGYALRREAFSRPLLDYPMVQDEVLKILVAYESGFALAFEAACAFDRAADLPEDDESSGRIWLRLATALAKYATAEGAVAASRRALEIIGGNGYTQDYVTARLVRDAQVLTVWEGPANIQALELARLLAGRYQAGALFKARIADIVARSPPPLAPEAAGVSAGLAEVEDALALIGRDETVIVRHARRLIGLMADVLAAALLLEAAQAETAAGDERRQSVLALFLAERLAPPARRGIVPGPGRDLASFTALLAYERPGASSSTPRTPA